MSKHKIVGILSIVAMIAMMAGQIPGGVATAAPISPTDETKVPHYFGPYPNWANSPYTLPDVAVDIQGDGTGATATATVGANGAITGVTITDPGSGYSFATIAFTGAGTGASADAVVTSSGAVSAVQVDAPGAGYVHPVVAFSGGAPDATATAFGSVDALSLVDGGAGYHVPTVAFDLPDDPNGTVPTAHVLCAGDVEGSPPYCTVPPLPDGTPGEVSITGIVLDTPGSGYTSAPGVAILDGTQFDPIRPGGTGAVASATLSVQSIVLDTFGSGYTATPVVTVTDQNNGPGQGALASATASSGTITDVANLVGGSGYVTGGGIRKFVDTLPGLGPTGANDLGQYLPIAQPDTTTFPGADFYVIAVVQHREQMHSDLPPTLLREYVQLSTSVVPGSQVPLVTDLKDGTTTPTLMPDGTQAVGVDDPHFLGPVIVATKDRPVRIVFYNLLPTGSEGDLFLPVDSSIMGSGMGPMMGMADPVDEGTVLDGVRNPLCNEYPKSDMCFKDNRATLHLHGGITPWISDGTPHQWITPADETTPWPQGVSVQNVPDMVGGGQPADVPDCSAANDGCQTFYYTNQQSARLMFYHDHAWGITRLNVYAGEAAGYVITDDTEQALFGSGGPYADMGEGTPLIIQDRTFVPGPAQLAQQDPTWDAARWGDTGNLWYHHVYMPAQNPGDPSGMSGFGRWMYGPWFWPPASPLYGPIDNPYYDPNCDPATAPDGFCEPALIPGTPNISAGMEQFNDTPIVNGTAYPTTTVDPTAYRFRILNAANDRFWNLQWYVADDAGTPNDPSDDTEVALKASELAAAQQDPNVVPTPDLNQSPAGPDWVQIGTEGGFLPAPVVVPAQPITWITDPTRFDVGNVDQHSLLLAPAERADTIVDFSRYAGQTLILYNDAPAAFPARVACYDYYTGGPDLTPACAPTTLPGYGPNTRTIMQVHVSASAPAPAFNLAALRALFRHHADGSGVFESGQHPIIVGQAAYNSAYGTNFVSAGWCNNPTLDPASAAATRCDGYARIQEGNHPTDLFGFNGLRSAFAPGSGKLQIPFQPKGIHDEMNSASFDEFGRMTANLGLEAPNANPLLQNIILYPYVNPSTELIDATDLPTGDVSVTPIATANDGTQIWKITHNGVDTHPIHFHLYDVQVLNRVTWDNIIIPPDPTELGWKDTIRVSPLEDTIVALRPVIPSLPFELPNSVRTLNPMMPEGSTLGFNNVDANGDPTDPITNQLVNFGWEYVYHCHILSHEEMDMMRPVTVAIPPNKADGLAFDGVNLTWNDNSINETSFLVQRSDDGTTWTDVGVIQSPLDQPNVHEVRTLADPAPPTTPVIYRVVTRNTVGYGGAYMQQTVKSVSDPLNVGGPAAPSNFTAVLGNSIDLAWQDNSNGTASFEIERTNNGGAWTQIATPVAGSTAHTDTAVAPSHTYGYRLRAVGGAIPSAWVLSTPETVLVPAAVPNAPANLTAVLQSGPQVSLTWTDYATDETGFEVERSISGSGSWTQIATPAVNSQSYADTTMPVGEAYDYRVRAVNAAGPSAWSNTATVAGVASRGPDRSPSGSPVRSPGLSDLDGQRRRRDRLRGPAIDRRRGELGRSGHAPGEQPVLPGLAGDRPDLRLPGPRGELRGTVAAVERGHGAGVPPGHSDADGDLGGGDRDDTDADRSVLDRQPGLDGIRRGEADQRRGVGADRDADRDGVPRHAGQPRSHVWLPGCRGERGGNIRVVEHGDRRRADAAERSDQRGGAAAGRSSGSPELAGQRDERDRLRGGAVLQRTAVRSDRLGPGPEPHRNRRVHGHDGHAREPCIPGGSREHGGPVRVRDHHRGGRRARHDRTVRPRRLRGRGRQPGQRDPDLAHQLGRPDRVPAPAGHQPGVHQGEQSTARCDRHHGHADTTASGHDLLLPDPCDVQRRRFVGLVERVRHHHAVTTRHRTRAPAPAGALGAFRVRPGAAPSATRAAPCSA